VMSEEDQEKKKRRAYVEIREMEIDDIPSVFHLGERLFTSSEVPNLYRTWDEFEVTGMFQEDPSLCLVAEYEDKIVGFALGTTITKSHSAWKYGHLAWLGVDPDCQRSGVATRLFKAFRERVMEEGVRIVLVDTEADNERAIRFFEDLGFRNPEEHIYLSLNLDQHLKLMKEKNGKNNG